MEAERPLHEQMLEAIKGTKNIIVRKQNYEDATILRDLESILLNDGDKLSNRSLSAMYSITQTIIKKIKPWKQLHQTKPLL